MSDATRITVKGETPYDVVVGEGLLGELPGLLPGAQRVAVVHPAALVVTAEAVRDDIGVGVAEGDAQARGRRPADGGLARAGRPDEDEDGARHRRPVIGW